MNKELKVIEVIPMQSYQVYVLEFTDLTNIYRVFPKERGVLDIIPASDFESAAMYYLMKNGVEPHNWCENGEYKWSDEWVGDYVETIS